VRTLRQSSLAMSLLAIPLPASRSTSSSRSVRGSAARSSLLAKFALGRLEAICDLAADHRMKRRFAGVHGQDGLDQFAAMHVLQQVAPRTRFRQSEGVLVAVISGEYEDSGGSEKRLDLLGGLDPVELGHGNVHQHHVRSQLHGQAGGLLAVAGLTKHDPDLVCGALLQRFNH
jgi:hypothetical protein